MFSLLTPKRISLLLIACYLFTLGAGYGRDNGWLIESDGHKRTIEYIGVRAAGELVQQGKPASAYDWKQHRAVHDALIGKPTENYYPWPYPPQYLAVAHALSQLPYVASALLMIAVTLAGYAAIAARIAGRREAALWALASPATLINTAVAHTGFLVGGLFGYALIVLRSRPAAAGIAIGLLAFKPQFGLLIPFALAAGGHWRSMLWAAATVALTMLGSIAAYGTEPWFAFVAQLDTITDIFRDGRLEMVMLITPYGAARLAGLAHDHAIMLQAVVTAAAAIAVLRLWRSEESDDLKAAGLIAATLLATPYLFVYDLTLLVIALLFLQRAAGAFEPIEVYAIMAGGLLLLGYAAIPLPVGLACNIAVAVLVWRRWANGRRQQSLAAANQLPYSWTAST